MNIKEYVAIGGAFLAVNTVIYFLAKNGQNTTHREPEKIEYHKPRNETKAKKEVPKIRYVEIEPDFYYSRALTLCEKGEHEKSIDEIEKFAIYSLMNGSNPTNTLETFQRDFAYCSSINYEDDNILRIRDIKNRSYSDVQSFLSNSPYYEKGMKLAIELVSSDVFRIIGDGSLDAKTKTELLYSLQFRCGTDIMTEAMKSINIVDGNEEKTLNQLVFVSGLVTDPVGTLAKGFLMERVMSGFVQYQMQHNYSDMERQIMSYGPSGIAPDGTKFYTDEQPWGWKKEGEKWRNVPSNMKKQFAGQEDVYKDSFGNPIGRWESPQEKSEQYVAKEGIGFGGGHKETVMDAQTYQNWTEERRREESTERNWNQAGQMERIGKEVGGRAAQDVGKAVQGIGKGIQETGQKAEQFFRGFGQKKDR